MKQYRRLGVLIPAVSDMLDYDLLEGIYEKAKELDYSTIVFTSAANMHEDENSFDEYISGQENIYELAACADLDGILVAGGRFFNDRLKNRIYTMLEEVDIPCIVMGEKSEKLPYVIVPQGESIDMITSHLIREHGCRIIYCLTGPEDNYEAQERLEGYRRAMERAGLEYSGGVFYGDFWYSSARKLATDIAEGRIAKPDAVVCANDIMANAMCYALMKLGYNIPKDIKITGYDGSLFAHIHRPSVTTVAGRELCLGETAVCRMHEMITGQSVKAEKFTQIFFGGASCGCEGLPDNVLEQTKVFDYFRSLVRRQLNRKHYITSNHIAKLSDSENLAELVMNVDAISGMLSGWTHMDMCLCKDWKIQFDAPENYRKKGYCESMQLILSKSAENSDMGQYEFETKCILPSLKNCESPKFLAITSLHGGDRIFGYVATEYKRVGDMSIDEHYVNWCDALSNGLKNLQKREYSDFVKKQIEQKSMYDFSTGLYNRRGFFIRLSALSAEKYTVIAVACEKNDMLYGGEIDVSMIIADVLRLTDNMNEVDARFGENIFVAAYPFEKGAPAENWISEFRRKLSMIQGDVLLETDEKLHFAHDVVNRAEMDEINVYTLCDRVKEKAMPPKKRTNYTEALGKLRSEIRFSPQENWSVPELAQRAGLSLSHFHRLYREQFGVSCMEDIICARITKAKHLLENTTLSVQQISDECGYENTSHFMRQFKSREGMSALKYRQGRQK